MASLLRSKPSPPATNLTDQDTEFNHRCHYTLDIYTCAHKTFRKPRIVHVRPCLSHLGSQPKSNSKCGNMADKPRIVRWGEECGKCKPGLGVVVVDTGGGSGNAGGKEGEGDGSDADGDDELMREYRAWTHLESSASTESFANGEPEVKTTVFQRVWRALMPGSAVKIAEGEKKEGGGAKGKSVDVADMSWTELERESFEK